MLRTVCRTPVENIQVKEKTGSNQKWLSTKCQFAIVVLVALVIYLVMWNKFINFISKKPHIKHHINKYLVVNTEGCKIPFLDPIHPDVSHLRRGADPLDCSSGRPPIVLQSSNPKHPALILNKDYFDLYGKNVSCSYQSIHRVSEGSVRLGGSVPIKENTVNIGDEFVFVTCVDVIGNRTKVVYDNFFAFIQKKEEVEKRCDEVAEGLIPRDDKLNVLLLGIDSVSKSHFLRLMKRTSKFLFRNISMVEMRGFNKLGLNTFPTVLPLLSGLTRDEVTQPTNEHTDHLPLIWKTFAQQGYRTFYAEDATWYATFNYLTKGFAIQPTDYYFRPFKLAVENKSITNKSEEGCIKDKEEAKLILDWTLKMFQVFKKQPVFAFTMLSKLSHDSLSGLANYDEPFEHFLKQMNWQKHLERTVVFFFSDHGYRFGRIRRPYVGRVESKLPFLFVLYPFWFEEIYPEGVANLKVNSNRLITTLDIHATIWNLLNPKNQTFPLPHSIDLLQQIVPTTRNCSTAKIPRQYCACISEENASVNDDMVTEAANHLLNEINDRTQGHRSSCMTFELSKITEAKNEIVSMDKVGDDNNATLVEITLEAKPGSAVFRGSVWVYYSSLMVQPKIQRLDDYSQQVDCIFEPDLKPLCLCRH